MLKGIMILGSPGAGKTTLGRLVAGKLGISFLDIDEYMLKEISEWFVCSQRKSKHDRQMSYLL